MSKHHRLPIALLALAFAGPALTGCASGYVDSAQTITGGFHEEKVGENLWQVSYSGNGYTSDETVQTYWLYHAAEIALREGFDGFSIPASVLLTSGPGGPAPDGPVLQRIVDHPPYGKPTMIATIRLLHGPIKQTRQIFDAHKLKTFLDPYVNGEKCGTNVCPHVHRYLFPDAQA